jgi:hypothetical protein
MQKHYSQVVLVLTMKTKNAHNGDLDSRTICLVECIHYLKIKLT